MKPSLWRRVKALFTRVVVEPVPPERRCVVCGDDTRWPCCSDPDGSRPRCKLHCTHLDLEGRPYP